MGYTSHWCFEKFSKKLPYTVNFLASIQPLEFIPNYFQLQNLTIESQRFIAIQSQIFGTSFKIKFIVLP